ERIAVLRADSVRDRRDVDFVERREERGRLGMVGVRIGVGLANDPRDLYDEIGVLADEVGVREPARDQEVLAVRVERLPEYTDLTGVQRVGEPRPEQRARIEPAFIQCG